MSADAIDSRKSGALGARPTSIAIFDTNAYRVLTHGLTPDQARAKARELRQAEDRVGRAALTHPIVVWELVTHLANPADPAYGDCLAALVALGEHTASRVSNDGGVCMVPDASATVNDALFNRLPPGYERSLENIGTLVTYVAKHAPDLSDPVAVQNIRHLATSMGNREEA